nr:unnamed protein product [Callosobruchus chinensis]
MKLPPHDIIRMEFENIEDLSGTQASLEVIDPTTAQIWFCGKEMYRDKKTVGDYVGKVENCKVIMKISKRGKRKIFPIQSSTKFKECSLINVLFETDTVVDFLIYRAPRT